MPLFPDPGAPVMERGRGGRGPCTLLDGGGCAHMISLRASGNCPLDSHPARSAQEHTALGVNASPRSRSWNVRLPNVSVCWGCPNKVPRSGWLKPQTFLFSQSQRGFEIKVLAGSAFPEAPRGRPSVCALLVSLSLLLSCWLRAHPRDRG